MGQLQNVPICLTVFTHLGFLQRENVFYCNNENLASVCKVLLKTIYKTHPDLKPLPTAPKMTKKVSKKIQRKKT
eukprot:UN22501